MGWRETIRDILLGRKGRGDACSGAGRLGTGCSCRRCWIMVTVFIGAGRIRGRLGTTFIGRAGWRNSLGFHFGRDSFASPATPYTHQKASASST